MKTRFSIFALFFIGLSMLIPGCVNKSTELKKDSPDGASSVMIRAEKKFALDPWKVSISVVRGEYHSPPAQIEVHTDELSEETVVIEWEDNATCYITFKQSDESLRQFILQVQGENISLKEV